MSKIIGDLDKFMIYENSNTGELLAVDKINARKMDTYYRDFNKFKETPENITIDGFQLVPDKEPDTLRIDESRKIETKVKDLETTWIRMGKK